MSIARKYWLILFGFGFSYLGNWVNLVALNLLVWHLTESPTAMASIFIVGPIARILTSFFAGSIIDRSNKQKLMIYSDIIRGILILLLPFTSSIWLISKYIPDEDKQSFNAILGMFSSGSFLIGPALAGFIIAISNISIAFWFNALTFFICALSIFKLPAVEDHQDMHRKPITWRMLKEDYGIVYAYIKKEQVFAKVFLYFQGALMIAFALDSQEATFIKQNLQASDSLYGVIVSIAGIGAIIGGAMAARYAKRFSTRQYIVYGLLLTTLCYTLFYSSPNVTMAIISFIALGVCMSFCNAGYSTFYQISVPTSIMGRFGSVSTMVINVLQIVFTLALGLLAEWLSLQMVCIVFGIVAIFLSLVLYVFMHSKSAYEGLKEEII
ncbi:MFS transporter [Lysinibacillus capsici]|uniref:MFS transporter n=1 Tax=Lysinibacillus capsici TaxID=2115968 RepID=UPI00247FE2CE|nr:MFS transporter [Lysinibacillus capsici]